MKTFAQRFLEKYVILESKVFPDEPCWHWTAAKGRNYAVISFEGKLKVAHKLAYELINGKVPTGFELDHVCKNSLCVNPLHLEAVTHSENCKRGSQSQVNKNRGAEITHCPAGHAYAGENLYIKPNGRRECKACVKDSGVRYRERLKNK